MKTQLFILFLFFGSLTSVAQITLTKFHSHDIGVSSTYSQSYEPAIFVTGSGENQTWDASTVITDESVTISVVASDNLPSSELFTGATMALNINNSYFYYEETDTELNYLGELNQGVFNTPFSNVKTRLKFPLNFGDSYSDDFEAILTPDDTYYLPLSIVGSIESSADAFGDLILPYGTIENTIRTKEIETVSESAEGYDPFNFTRTIYTWYDLEYGSRIAYFIDFQVENYSDSNKTFGYLSQEDYTSIKETSEISNLMVYPNPASEYFQISGTESGSEYLLINQQGQEVLSGFLAGDERIDTSEFTSGIYFLEIKNDQGVSRKKISIQ